MLKITQVVFPVAGMGARYDCGTKLGYLQANLQLALKHPEVGAEFRRYLRGLGCHIPKQRAARSAAPIIGCDGR